MWLWRKVEYEGGLDLIFDFIGCGEIDECRVRTSVMPIKFAVEKKQKNI